MPLRDEKGYNYRKCIRTCVEGDSKIILDKPPSVYPTEPRSPRLISCESSALDYVTTECTRKGYEPQPPRLQKSDQIWFMLYPTNAGVIAMDHPVLYETSNPDYMRTELKDELWENIAIEQNYSNESDLESKSIRSSFNSHAIPRLVPLGESSLTHFKSAVTCKNLFLCCACPLPGLCSMCGALQKPLPVLCLSSACPLPLLRLPCVLDHAATAAGDCIPHMGMPVAHVPILSVSAPAPISLLAPIPAWVVAHTDTIAIGIGSFVDGGEQTTWLPCGIGGFFCCVCFISGGGNVVTGEEENFGCIL
uniref:MADF domain-containing protein n=1 Tax=Timema bartmani TaxID=61472 RepID=A0A7R9EYQ2_9NEOP|nr:unnamed protein product [Timema bartmani]